MTIGVSKMKIQGVASCHFLCMDGCGLLYGSPAFGDECIFNEIIEPDHYNTYSSAKYSNERRILYLALNRRGQPRKVLLRSTQPLGRLSSYVRVLVRVVTTDKHQDSACPTTETDSDVERFHCRRRKTKKRKKCEPCVARKTSAKRKRVQFKFRKKCGDGADCRGKKKKKKQQLADVGKRKKKKKKKKFAVRKKMRESIAADDDADETSGQVERTTRWGEWYDETTTTAEELSTSYAD